MEEYFPEGFGKYGVDDSLVEVNRLGSVPQDVFSCAVTTLRRRLREPNSGKRTACSLLLVSLFN